MKNVKDQVYAALCTVSENVSDAIHVPGRRAQRSSIPKNRTMYTKPAPMLKE